MQKVDLDSDVDWSQLSKKSALCSFLPKLCFLFHAFVFGVNIVFNFPFPCEIGFVMYSLQQIIYVVYFPVVNSKVYIVSQL